MTGFGNAEDENGACRVRIEIRGVNHRSLSWKAKFPPFLNSLEAVADPVIRRFVQRGALYVAVTCESLVTRPQVSFNRELAGHYAEELRRLGEELGLKAEPRLELILSLPGVTEAGESDPSPDDVRDLFLKVLESALRVFVECREREGRALLLELLDRTERLESIVGGIQQRMPSVLDEYRSRLKERVLLFLAEQGHQLEDVDVLREMALVAEKADISEEVTRLVTHLVELRRLLEAGGGIGRPIDFLTQELLREASTVAAKSVDAELTHRVVDLKTELGRIKEQAQNLE
ncbi:MAG: YicC/YloC family endoribonuclease [Planctomycetota bacterium]